MIKDALQELWNQTMDLADSLPLVYMSALIGYLAAMADSWIAGMRRD